MSTDEKKTEPAPVRCSDEKYSNSFINTCPPTRKNLPPYLPPSISIGETKKKILGYVFAAENPHSISRLLHMARSTVQQHLRELQKMKLVSKDGIASIWQITPAGIGLLGGQVSFAGYERGGAGTTDWLQDRAHNIKIKVEVRQQPESTAWLSAWKPNKKMKNVVFYTQLFGDIVTTYTGKSLIFQMPILRFRDAELANAEAGRIAKALIDKYEQEIEGLKLGDKHITAQLISQHHAIPNEPYAKFCVRHGITYRDEVLDIDSSESPELEFIDAEKAHLHHGKYIEFVKDFATKDVLKPSEITQMIGLTEKQIAELAIAQQNTHVQLQGMIQGITALLGQKPTTPEQTLGQRPEYIQ